MPSEQMEFTVATLALRPDATSVRPGARCWVIDVAKEYRARNGNWYEILDQPQAAADPEIGNSGSGVTTTMSAEADLDAIETVGITPGAAGSIVQYIDATSEQLKTWQLRSSTAASVAGSVRRAGDYNGTTNTKVWFLVA